MSELKVGVIGCGGHARGHFAMIKNEPRMKLIAVAEIDGERLDRATAQHEPPFAFRDDRNMLDRVDLDVVYVVTMPGHLLPIVQECLGRDSHTSIEKSPGMNVGETQQMLDAARQSKGKVMRPHQIIFEPRAALIRLVL